jgi:hypothetical protein
MRHTFPVWEAFVEGVHDLELIRLALGDLVKLLAKQDVFLGPVCVDKSNLGLVRWVVVDGLQDGSFLVTLKKDVFGYTSRT